MVFIIKGFNLVLGVSFELPFLAIFWFPNNKYPPNTKNYLPCFVLGGGLVLGGRDYLFMDISGSIMNKFTNQHNIRLN